jgi:NADPH-dependent 2,4-dienoyl-CoA reductase/sulfur reductase-like enzyme
MSTRNEQVIVVGGGPAGCAAALEAAKLGLAVTLVDEHPQSTTAMSLDAPYFYGARLPAALSDASATAERVLGANEALMECLEAGVDVLTGTCAWGVFIPGENNRHLSGKQLGLADETKSCLIPFDYLILAPGARDLVLSFPGWHLPGVLGVKAASVLLQSYQALGGRKMLVLGSGNAALTFAQAALTAGIEVVGLVEPSSTIQGARELVGALEAAGVPIHLDSTIERALGDQEVTGARITRASGGMAFEVACDTVCMAYGAVPNIELASVAGCQMEYIAALGGWVPKLGPDLEASEEGLFVVGDGAGITEAAFVSADAATAQGRSAARAVARRVGLIPSGDDSYDLNTRLAGSAALFPPMRWLESLLAASGLDVQLCQCEEVTRCEFLHVEPPRYLGVRNWKDKEPSAVSAPGGALNQDFLKRMTRVGMGHCQGRRCREHSALLVAHAKGVELSQVLPGSYRIPVRALSLSVMSAHEETPEVARMWPAWSWLHPIATEKLRG